MSMDDPLIINFTRIHSKYYALCTEGFGKFIEKFRSFHGCRIDANLIGTRIE